MKQYPKLPRVENAPDELFDDGHLWLQEKVDGALLRFRVEQSGLVQFGDRRRVYDTPGAVPRQYSHAVRHVRENLDRDALRRAVEDVETVVFFGEATHYHTIEYDWERTPSFLGFDVWSASAEQFRPPDQVEQIFDRLGLHPVNTFERERRGRYFDPESYTIPQSAWYDGPAEGVVVRDKRGHRATLTHIDSDVTAEPLDGSVEKLTRRYTTDRRIETVTDSLETQGQPATVKAVTERLVEMVVRESYARVAHGQSTVEFDELRSAIAESTRAYLDG